MRSLCTTMTAVAVTLSFFVAGASAQEEKKAEPAQPKHVALLKDAKPQTGVINVYQKEDQLFAELNASNYSGEYIILISIAKGIGEGPLLGGMTWGFGDDWIWKFRKIDDKVHIIRRNVRFKAKSSTPEASAVANAYTDSVLYSLPIITKGPKGGDLVDLSSVFMSDLPQIGEVLPGFVFSPQKSTWAKVKDFEDNLELEVAATYQSSGRAEIETVADSRGVTIHVHYSISKLPSTGYSPREADPRVGYFLTVVKDYSEDGKNNDERFVRYINRWHLEKADPSAKLSPPKKPIIFWIENTVPFKYRAAIRDGIEEWNKAFEQAGFVDAIEVRQQPDNADWDPEDINYNTFRWMTSSAGFAMGPSRVNPYNGQILDADIIFDADFLSFWKHEFETFTPESVAAMTGGDLEPTDAHEEQPRLPMDMRQCALGHGMSREFALGATALAGVAKMEPKQREEELEKLIMQGLKEVTMHEVGHTLGLRHNFKASTWKSLKEINDPKNAGKALVASVMDYSPINLMPEGQPQGDYYAQTIGPYDYWAIEYGYKTGTAEELQKLASRSGEDGLDYTTDEDTVGTDPDPFSNRFDLGADPVEYAKSRSQVVKDLMPGLVERMAEEGEDYTKVRRAFNILLSQIGQSTFFTARVVGGLNTSRSHKGDEGARAPIEPLDPKQQRAALDVLEQNLFNDKPFDFPTEIYSYLAPSRWRHWGTSSSTQKDFPIHDYIAMWQDRALSQLLSSVTLQRIHDTELKIPADKDAFTTAELIERLTDAIFSEVDSIGKAKKDAKYSNRQPAISSLRRNLQRIYLRRMSNMAMGRSLAPEDCQTIAYMELSELKDGIDKLLSGDMALDSYTKAHLKESSDRIAKVLDAQLTLASP
ncbi:MAG: zinc-dependent metalloprotease [Pirellulaceae bacterium]